MADDIDSQNLACDAAVEALNHTVGLWRAGLGFSVWHFEFRAAAPRAIVHRPELGC